MSTGITAGMAAAGGQLRHSHGLEQLTSALREREGMSVLDLGEFTQANVLYVTGLGHRLYSENLYQAMDATFGEVDPSVTQQRPDLVRDFLEQILQFEAQQFDAILAWDVLEHLTRPVLQVVMERLHTILRPHGVLLACFHVDLREETVPVCSFRIADSKTLLLSPRGRRKPAHSFNNRTIEKLFEKFRSVKFFLTREHLHEVIVKR